MEELSKPDTAGTLINEPPNEAPSMARPTKYDPTIARLIVARVALGATRGEAADAAGIALRSVQYWLARGRSGEAPFDGFAERLDSAADQVRRAKVRARYGREIEISKERWQTFKASRERWWLDRLGPLAFWTRRLSWCEAKGRDHGRTRALGEIGRLVRAEQERRTQGA